MARTWATLPGGAQDLVALIRDPGNGGDFAVSRRYGLLSGPVLANPNGATGAPVLAAAELPAPLAASIYGPLHLFAMQPGDELGYVQQPFSYGLPCERSYILRRMLTRQLTADSLVFTFQEQQQRQTFGAPGCGTPAGTALLPARRGRLAVALRTGRSRQYKALPLLSGEYQPYATPSLDWLLTSRLRAGSGSPACAAGTGLTLQAVRLYPDAGNPGVYRLGIDLLGEMQAFAPGLGAVLDYDTALEYFRRGAGRPLTCGPAAHYATLLPARAAQAAAVFVVFPNPAGAVATVVPRGPGPHWCPPNLARRTGPHRVGNRAGARPSPRRRAAARAARRPVPGAARSVRCGPGCSAYRQRITSKKSHERAPAGCSRGSFVWEIEAGPRPAGNQQSHE